MNCNLPLATASLALDTLLADAVSLVASLTTLASVVVDGTVSTIRINHVSSRLFPLHAASAW